MNSQHTFEINDGSAGLRLDEFLASRLGGLSRIRIAALIAQGACSVNKSAAESGRRLKAGDIVEFEVGDGPPTAMTPEPLPLDIVYEDSAILVVVKAAGMLVHPTIAVKSGTLANALSYYLNKHIFDMAAGEPISIHNAVSLVRPGLVHRLDRATSGLMVIAKTQQALTVLTRHFRRRLVTKRYLALVRGRLDAESGVIAAPIGRDADKRPQWWVQESGKPAETKYRALKFMDDSSLLELEPITGRTNQLRIHCAYAGHPIVGDEFYGGNEGDSPGRLFLHAWRLGFHHPRTGETLDFRSDLPNELAAFIDTPISAGDQASR